MSQIYLKANKDSQLQKLKQLFKAKNFTVEFALGEWRFTPILIDFERMSVSNLTSATMCHCMFNIAKKPLIDFEEFETILSLNKEN
ncbi:MAG: hypothetical protein IJB10_04240 [Clostridia bacterium]|nr:hypothetical protein [Clostridia bacterium]